MGSPCARRPMRRDCRSRAPKRRSCCRIPSRPRGFSSAPPSRSDGDTPRTCAALCCRAPCARPRGSLHQGAYYQHLTRALGFESGPLEPVLTVTDAVAATARAQLVERGWDAARPLFVFAPGAAYGTAKRWLLPYVARVATELVRGRGATCVMVGGRGDAAAAAEVLSRIDADVRPHVIDLTGQTTLETLAGVLRLAAACVANDSGAMHMAAAVGTPVVAVFGPTREYETAPLTRSDGRAEVLTHPVWCRPCMLRECPIDHRCMKGIVPERVCTRRSRRCYPQHREGGHRVGRCAARLAHRRPSQQEGGRRGRHRRGRIRVRQGGARLARGACAHPRVRLHRDRPRRRRQRGQQRRGARRPRHSRRRGRPRRARAAASWRRCIAASIRGTCIRVADAPTPVKTRILAGGIHSAKQQVVRIDRGVAPADRRRASASRSRRRRSKRCMHGDAVLVSDYGSGLITPAFVDKVRRTLQPRQAADSRADRHALPAAQLRRD